MIASTILILICLLYISPTSSYNITTTIEAPFIQQSSAGFEYVGIETFDTVTTGWHTTYATDFGLGANSSITGTYYNLIVVSADAYGGAEGMGNRNYLTCSPGSTIRLSLTQVGERGINYFGLWLSALDSDNSFEFYFQGLQVASWNTWDVLSLVRNNPDYYGNPTTTPRVDLEEAFVFMNFYFNDVLIDEVRFIQATGAAKFESDSHTVGYFINQTGLLIPGPSITTTTTTTTSGGTPFRVFLAATAAATAGAAAAVGAVALFFWVGGPSVAAVPEESPKPIELEDTDDIEAIDLAAQVFA